MKTIFSIFLAFLFAPMSGFSQSVNTLGEFNKFIAQNWSSEYVRIGQYKVKGSPFLYGEPLMGNLTYSDKTNSGSVKILYDLYNQKVGIEYKGKILESNNQVSKFSITTPSQYGAEDLHFVYSDFLGDNSVHSYLNIVEEGAKYGLLKLYKIKLESDPGNMMDKELKIFQQYYDFYIYDKAKKQLTKVKLKEKELLKALGGTADIRDYITKNGLDITKEKDLQTLIRAIQ